MDDHTAGFLKGGWVGGTLQPNYTTGQMKRTITTSPVSVCCSDCLVLLSLSVSHQRQCNCLWHCGTLSRLLHICVSFIKSNRILNCLTFAREPGGGRRAFFSFLRNCSNSNSTLRERSTNASHQHKLGSGVKELLVFTNRAQRQDCVSETESQRFLWPWWRPNSGHSNCVISVFNIYRSLSRYLIQISMSYFCVLYIWTHISCV